MPSKSLPRFMSGGRRFLRRDKRFIRYAFFILRMFLRSDQQARGARRRGAAPPRRGPPACLRQEAAGACAPRPCFPLSVLCVAADIRAATAPYASESFWKNDTHPKSRMNTEFQLP